jgi:hypothetical protein
LILAGNIELLVTVWISGEAWSKISEPAVAADLKSIFPICEGLPPCMIKTILPKAWGEKLLLVYGVHII